MSEAQGCFSLSQVERQRVLSHSIGARWLWSPSQRFIYIWRRQRKKLRTRGSPGEVFSFFSTGRIKLLLIYICPFASHRDIEIVLFHYHIPFFFLIIWRAFHRYYLFSKQRHWGITDNNHGTYWKCAIWYFYICTHLWNHVTIKMVDFSIIHKHFSPAPL